MDKKEQLLVLQKILNNFPSMIGYWDKDLKNKFSNAAYLNFFNLEMDQILNKHIRDVIGEELYRKNLPYIENVLAGKEQYFEREIPLCNGDIKFTQAIYFPDFENGEVQGFFALVIDNSQLKKVEREKEEIYQKLVQSLKMTALVEMAEGVAHEIKNPLSIISKNANFAAELINEKEIDRNKLLEFISIIQNTTQRVEKIVSGLQVLSQEKPKHLKMGEDFKYENI